MFRRSLVLMNMLSLFQVLSGLKVLKTMQLAGLQLKPEKYRKLERTVVDPAYDIYGEDEVFDTESLRQTMQDYLHVDPAARYQIAKNNFERAVVSAKVSHPSIYISFFLVFIAFSHFSLGRSRF